MRFRASSGHLTQDGVTISSLFLNAGSLLKHDLPSKAAQCTRPSPKDPDDNLEILNSSFRPLIPSRRDPSESGLLLWPSFRQIDLHQATVRRATFKLLRAILRAPSDGQSGSGPWKE